MVFRGPKFTLPRVVVLKHGDGGIELNGRRPLGQFEIFQGGISGRASNPCKKKGRNIGLVIDTKPGGENSDSLPIALGVVRKEAGRSTSPAGYFE